MEIDKSTLNDHCNSRMGQWIYRVHFLPSEELHFMDKTVSGGICLTNFRLILYCKQQCGVISIPNWLMRYCEASTSLVHLSIVTKIGTTFTCQFASVGTCEAWIKQINALLSSPKQYKTSFAVLFHEELKQRIDNHPILSTPKEIIGFGDTSFEATMVYNEFERLEFNSDWKITDENSSFKICKSYPRYHIMPRGVSDQDISSMASFRSHHRFPSVVWRSRKTGAVLLRCAQPCVGIMYSRNELDERFVAAVLENCRKVSQPVQSDGDSHKLLIIDARDYTAAQFNRFRGGGFEFGEYYDQSQIRFMNLPNLHYVRKSFEALIGLFRNPDSSWLQKVDTTMWLSYISQLLKSAVDIAAALEVHSRPVMVHCTDGWDRTPQLTSLAKLILDPYYRTIEGFRFLVEREWLQFGHKFADRCGHSFGRSSPEEQSPVFLQWLDCVHQIQRQFPGHFEFNELFLLKIAIHTYSGLFGTFLCNSEFERQAEQKNLLSCSLWAFLNPKYNWSIFNYLYKPNHEVITPVYHVSDLVLWHNLYKKALLPSNSSGSQPVLFSAPFRRGSDTSTLQITTKLDAPAKSGPSTATSALMPPPTPIAISTEAGDRSLHASGIEARQRSQSLSDVSLLPGQLNLAAVVSLSSLKDISKQCAATALKAQADLSTDQVDEALNVSLSNQNVAAKVSPYKHVRTGSDPPPCSEGRRYRGFRISSLGDNDTLVVNETILDDSHEGVDDDVIGPTSVSRTTVTRIPEEIVENGSVNGNLTPSSLHPSRNFSAVSSMCHSEVSLSGTNFEGKMNWIEGYFTGPVYSTSFRSLAKESRTPLEDEMSNAQNEPPVQDEEKLGEESNGSAAQSATSRVRSHTEGEILSSLQSASNVNLPRSTIQLASVFSDQSNALSNGQSCGSTASVETQLLPEHSVSVDWDSLPLQIDLITMTFHEDLRKRDRQVAQLQAQLEALREQNEQLKAKLNEKNAAAAAAAVAAATTSTYSVNGSVATMMGTSQTQLLTTLANGTHSSSLPARHNGHGNEPINQSPSIVEALTDAIDNQLEVGSVFGGYGNAFEANRHIRVAVNDSDDTTAGAAQLMMTQSVTDDMLLNWPDLLASSSSPNSLGVAPISNSSTSNISSLPEFQPPLRRKRCGPSTSSDYSTFDFVETSAVHYGPLCSGCDRLLEALNSSVTCSYCYRCYCGGCADTPQILNSYCKPICGVCHRRHFSEAKEMSASYECAFTNRTSTSGMICSQSCGNTSGSCRNLERRFPSGSSLGCSSAHSQNGTARA